MQKLLWIIVLILVSSAIGKKTIDNVHIALAGDPSRMTISWWTKDQTPTSTVHYGLSHSTYPMVASGSQSSYSHKAGWNHNVVLTNLLPNTQYYYICGDDSYAYSGEFNFTTLHTSFLPTTVAVYGDLGTDNSDDSIARLTSHALNGDLGLFVHLGDISYANDHPLQYEETWNTWFTEMQSVMAHVPYMVSPGNHESWCRNPICAMSTYNFTTYKEKFRMPGDESGSGTNMFYSFDYYNIHFIAISTESDYPGAPPFDPNPSARVGEPSYAQQNWIEQDLQKAVANRHNVPWIILFGHRAIYSPTEQRNGVPTGYAARVQDFFEPLLKKYNVDIFFSGHVHAYSRTYPVYNNTVTSTNYNNPTDTVHVISGAPGSREGHSEFPDELPYWYAGGDDSHFGYGTLSVHNNTALTWNYYRSDTDELLDTFTLTKSH